MIIIINWGCIPVRSWKKVFPESIELSDTIYDVVVLGAGFAGAFTVEALCKELPSTAKLAIVDSHGLLNDKSSSRNECFKMHTGLHYIGDRKTAEICLSNSIQMASIFYELILDADNSKAPTRRGRHYLVSNSHFDADYVKSECAHLQTIYAKLIDQYPDAAKVFGEPTEFIKYLSQEDYSYIAPSIPFKKNSGETENVGVVLGIETPECQIEFEKFRNYFTGIFLQHQDRLSCFYGYTVVQINPADFIGYVVQTKCFDEESGKWQVKDIWTKSIINCTWQNIDVIDRSLNYTDHTPCTIRAKALVRASVPPSLSQMNTCIFFSGPHVSITRVPDEKNQPNDMIVTYEPVTNIGHYHSELPTHLIEDQNLRMLVNFSPLNTSLKERETLKSKIGQEILSGASEYVPALKNAIIKEVSIGFVKMLTDTGLGNEYLYEKNSPIHQRREEGIQVRDLCYISFSGMKMTYTFRTAQTVVEILKQHIVIQKEIATYLETILEDVLKAVLNHPECNQLDELKIYRFRSALLQSLAVFTLARIEESYLLTKENITTTTSNNAANFEQNKHTKPNFDEFFSKKSNNSQISRGFLLGTAEITVNEVKTWITNQLKELSLIVKQYSEKIIQHANWFCVPQSTLNSTASQVLKKDLKFESCKFFAVGSITSTSNSIALEGSSPPNACVSL